MSLKEILGHRSINSTAIYISLASTTLQKYASRIDSLRISYE
jgi:site-specific recombinase XerD